MLHTVEIKDHAFLPAILEIKAGDRVKWHNRDGVRHSARNDGSPAFDTGLIPPGRESQEIVFDGKSGEHINYYCEPHPHMHGTIIVST